jgi:putative oxidoreductase
MHSSAHKWQGFAPYFLSLLRIVTSAVLMTSGTTKVFGWPAASRHPVELMSQVGIGGILEVLCGALLIIGLFTRINAFLMSGMMAVAYFQFHMASGGFWPTVNGGAAAIAFCFIFLYISAAGGGPWSLDAQLRKSTSA